MTATTANRRKHAASKTDAETCLGNIANKIRETSGKSTSMRRHVKHLQADIFRLSERVATSQSIDQFIWRWLDYSHDPKNRTLNSERKSAELRQFAVELVSEVQQRLEDAQAKAAR